MSTHEPNPMVTSINENTVSRRSILGAAPVAGIAAFMVASTPEDAAASDTGSEWPADEDDTADLIAYHVEQITSVLNRGAPNGAQLRSFDFRCVGGEILYDSIWASAINSDCRLYSARPCVYDGWRDRTPKIAGEDV